MLKRPVRIPFDSFCLRAAICEAQPWVGATVEKIVQPDANTIYLVMFLGGKEASLLLSCNPQTARLHLTTRRSGAPKDIPSFCASLRSKLVPSTLLSIEQVGFDRIAHLNFRSEHGTFRLIAELMGKHANLVLVDGAPQVLSAAKIVGPAKSKRPILSGKPYLPPPFPSKPSLMEAKPGDDLTSFEGLSPFLHKLIEARGLSILREPCLPVIVEGSGAYPISVKALGLKEREVESFSLAAERHFADLERSESVERLRHSLLTRLERLLLARDVALSDLAQAADSAARAGESQLRGELILAYGHQLEPEATELKADDYEGNPITIRLNPELDYLENAKRYFERAKKAKHGAESVHGQQGRLKEDRQALEAMIAKITSEQRLDQLRNFEEESLKRRWLHAQPDANRKAEDKPFEGKRIRTLVGPGGVNVLYGENAEANDYLTLRIARPDDYWLHVRGATSAHVIIQTNRKPDKINLEILLFAAKVAVQNSVSKHSGYVAVDYTLRKYVRKPRGAKAGSALYTHEKTLHIEGG